MIQDYLEQHLAKARYEMIDGNKRFYAEIEELRGVWATGKTLEDCRRNLLSTLENWLVFRLRRNLPVPRFKLTGVTAKVKSYA